jgi:hypothetical protein
MILTAEQTEKWLYYETGFEQLHPHPGIIKWMEEQGYQYHRDWQCVHRRTITARNVYSLMFPSDEIKTMFVLRWS